MPIQDYLAKGREAKKARREAAKANTTTINGYTIRPSSGQCGGIGWELVPKHGPTWYFMAKAECELALPRHRDTYHT